MANFRGKSIDTTHLSADITEERLIQHRDLVAHAIRWSAVARRMSRGQLYKTARVLDVGCGVDIPLGRLLYSNKFIPLQYVALDYNGPDKLKVGFFAPKRGGEGRFPIRAFGGVDFADDEQVEVLDESMVVLGSKVDLPNVITSFEVLEHVEPGHAVRMLRKMLKLARLTPGCVVYLSTPCYDEDVGAAKNHVNEMKRDAFGAVLENVGFAIVENYGTFASVRDYKQAMYDQYPKCREMYERLNAYYDSNLIANLWAPLFPEYARNNFWALRPAAPDYTRKFSPLSLIPEPWTSSEKWRDLLNSEKE